MSEIVSVFRSTLRLRAQACMDSHMLNYRGNKVIRAAQDHLAFGTWGHKVQVPSNLV